MSANVVARSLCFAWPLSESQKKSIKKKNARFSAHVFKWLRVFVSRFFDSGDFCMGLKKGQFLPTYQGLASRIGVPLFKSFVVAVRGSSTCSSLRKRQGFPCFPRIFRRNMLAKLQVSQNHIFEKKKKHTEQTQMVWF